MSGQWTIENDTGAELTVRAPNGFAVELDANSADPRERFAYFAIRQQARDLDQLRAECDLLTHKVICCGVAAWHSDPLLTTTGAYASIWNSAQAESVRKLRAERDQLRAQLAEYEAESATLTVGSKWPKGL